MPRFNLYQALHTTVIGPEGRPLEIQIRTRQMHYTAEYGVAAHWIYKGEGRAPAPADGRGRAASGGATAPPPGRPRTRTATATATPRSPKPAWLRHLLDWQQELQDPREFMETLKIDLFEDEVFVFTPKGEVKSLPAGATPLDFAYAVHTDVGHRCVGAKVNGKITPLHYRLQSGDIVEILTSKQERGPSRDWLSLVKTSRARNKIRAWFTRERREDAEHRGRELLQETLRKQGLPAQKITGSALLADVIREMGFRKADDFYVALGQAKISTKVVANKLLQRLKQGEAVTDERPAEGLARGKDERARPLGTASDYGIKVEGINDVMVRLAKCCRPVPGDEIVGLHLARSRHHDPPRELQERQGADEGPRALHEGVAGTARTRRRSGSSSRSTPGTAPACSRTSRARSPRPASTSSRRAARQPPDGEEPLRGRGRRHRLAQELRHPPAERRLGLRRLPRHARRLSGRA